MKRMFIISDLLLAVGLVLGPRKWSALCILAWRPWMVENFSRASALSCSREAETAPAASPSSSSSSSSSSPFVGQFGRGFIDGVGADQAVDRVRRCAFLPSDLVRRSRISAMVVGQAEWPDHVLEAVLDALGDFDFALAVRSSTEPISRMYMRTGSVVRPNSESTVDRACSASSSTSSSSATAGRSRT